MSSNIRVNKHTIAIIGGDLRFLHLAILLKKQGFPVTVYGNLPTFYQLSKEDSNYFNEEIVAASSLSTAVKQNDVIIGPIPFSKDGEYVTSNKMFESISVSSFLQLLTHKPYVFGGAMNTNITTFLTEHEIPFCDVMELESVAIGNAIATAEGTIVEAIKRSTINLHQRKALILGFGRCAKILAQKLKGFDVSVTIAARKAEALAYAKAYGFGTCMLQNVMLDLSSYDFIFNTVPAKVLAREALLTTKADVTIIDIASAPGGVDFAAAQELGINASLCLALPGIYAPKTSAEILLESIVKQLEVCEDH